MLLNQFAFYAVFHSAYFNVNMKL